MVVVVAAELPGSCTSWLMCVFCSMVHAEKGRRPPARGASVSSRDRLANKEQQQGVAPVHPHTHARPHVHACVCVHMQG